MRRSRNGLLWLAFSALSACQFDPRLPIDTIIHCTSDNDCPMGRVCSPTIFNCVSLNGDKDGPGLLNSQVSPAIVNRDGIVRIAFSVTEPLFGEPLLSLDPAVLVSSNEQIDFTYEHTVTAAETEGEQKITAFTHDITGNPSTLSLGTVVYDFTKPEVISDSIAITPTLARRGERILVQVAFSELLRDTPSLHLGTGPAILPSRSAGALATFELPVTEQVPNGMVAVTLDPLIDLAGNQTPATQLGIVRIDSVAPQVARLEIANGYTRRSPRPGFNTFTIIAEGNPGADDALKSIEVRFLGQTIPCDAPSPTRHECEVTVLSTMPEGDARIQALFTDLAGNTGIGNIHIALDFTPPQVAAGSYRQLLTAPANAPISAVTALGSAARLSLQFSLTEPTATPLNLSLGGRPLTCTNTGIAYSCTYTHTCGGLLADGPQRLQLKVTDAVGNEFVGMPAEAQVVNVDCTAPAAPAVESPGKVRWHRAPWGASWSPGAAGARIEVAPGGVLEVDGLLRAGIRLADGSFSPLATGRVGAAVSTQLPVFDQADRTEIAVQTIDGAGNVSPVVMVRDNTVTAAFAGSPEATTTAPDLFQNEIQDTVLHGEYDRRWTTATTPGLALLAQRVNGPTLRTEAAGIGLPNGQVLLFGGNGANSAPLSDAWVYDANAGLWQQVVGTTAPSARSGHLFAALPTGDALMVGGAQAGAGLIDTWVFEAATRTWAQVGGEQPAPRSGHHVTTLSDGRVLLFGGIGQTVLADAWLFDSASRSWSAVTAVGPSGRTRHQLAPLPNGRALLFGGDTGSGVSLNDTWVFDGQTRQWTQVMGTQPPARSNHTLVTLASGDVLLEGGINFGFPLGDTWLFRAATSRWEPVQGTQPSTRSGEAVARMADGRVLVNGGRNGAALGDSWLFDPSNERWSRVSGVQPGARTGHLLLATRDGRALLTSAEADSWQLEAQTMTWRRVSDREPAARKLPYVIALPNGRVVMHGGDVPGSAYGRFADTWTYDTNSHLWAEVVGLNPGFPTNATTSPLPNGKALLYGGQNYTGSNTSASTSAAWLFDPAVDQWTQFTGNTPPDRLGAPAVLLPDGKVFITGGMRLANNMASARGDTWTFDATTNTFAQIGTTSPMTQTYTLGALGLTRSGRVLKFASVQWMTNNTYTGGSWLFTPANTWAATTGAQPAGRTGFTMGPVGTNQVLMFGGGALNPYRFKDTWLFDVTTNGWTQLNINGPIEQISAQLVPLSDGRLFLPGSDALWLFHPTRKTWERASGPQGHQGGSQDNPIGMALTTNDTVVYGNVGAYWEYRPNGGALGALGMLRLSSMGLRTEQVTSLNARATAGADGFTSDDTTAQPGVELQLYRTGETGPLFQTCAGAYAPSTSVRDLTCNDVSFAGSSHVALRIKPLGVSNGHTVNATITGAQLDVNYRVGP